jgi:myo-inositol-1(or 4)-monophosphatase
MLTTAREAVIAASEILKENFRKISRAQIRVKSKNDFITYVDERSEQKIIDIIQNKFPSHDIFAEETGSKKMDSDYRWIIDPLDGTKNYISGIPIFSISIALQYKNDIILGIIYDPIQNEMFYAEKNQGAFLNGNPIKVNNEPNLENSLLATGFPFKFKQYLPPYMDCFEDLFLHCSGIRRMGSAAIDLAYVAAGRFEGFWELGLSPWDIAAGAIIIKEAGGFISDFWKNNNYLQNTLIHDQFLAVIKKYFPKPLIIERESK